MSLPFDPALAEDLAAAPFGLLLADGRGTILWCNEALAAIFEWPRAELAGRSVESLLPPARRDGHVRLREAYQEGATPRPHGPGRVLAGATRSGRELAVAVTLVPLDRAAAGRVLALVESVEVRGEKLYRAVFDQSHQATWVLSADGAVLAANRRARAIMCRDDFGAGQQALEVCFPRASRASRASLALALDAAREGESVRITLDDVDAGGAPRVHEITLRPAHGSEGDALFQVLAARDVTGQRRREEELVAARLAAEAAERAKAAFLARMSHEMRTPLHAVLGFARAARDEAAGPAARAEALRQIEAAGERLLALVEGVLEIARVEAGGLGTAAAPVDLRALVTAALDAPREAAAARDLAFASRVAAGLPTWLSLDERRLRRVLDDLLAHAVEVSRAGTVTLEIDWEPEGRRDRLVLSVADQGPALDPAALADPGSTFDGGERAGAGLGLALARRLVLLMGGELRIEPTPSRGNRLRVELPAAPVAGFEETPAEEVAAPPTRPGAGLDRLAALEAGLRDELERAARVADWRALAAAAERAVAAEPELAPALAAALDRFDYQAILAVLATSRSESSASSAQTGRAGTTGDASASSSSTDSGGENR